MGFHGSVANRLVVKQTPLLVLVVGSDAKTKTPYVIIVPITDARHSVGYLRKRWPIEIGAAASIPILKHIDGY